MQMSKDRMLESVANRNPMIKRVQEMTQGKSESEIQQICKNICDQKGIDFNQAKEQFINKMGMNL